MRMGSIRRIVLAVYLALVFRTAVGEDKVSIFTSEDLAHTERGVERALLWLSNQQNSNGSFPTRVEGQPGVTSLCVLAFAAQGHLPGEGEYGEHLQAAVRFMQGSQKPNGLLAQIAPGGADLSRDVSVIMGSTAVYNHALTALVLSELYSMGGDTQGQQESIESAVQATLTMQSWPKPASADIGGWRYLNYREGKPESDLSVTGWQLMFLRSAKNAGFDVPADAIENGVAYVRRCFHDDYSTFTMLANEEDRRSRGMAGAGILAMAHAGLHKSIEARKSGDWLLKEGFPIYNESRHYTNSYTDDRYHYGVFCASQAMYQLGGKHWEKFYPPVFKLILASQSEDGSWEPDSHSYDGPYGRAYTTALMVLTLSTPNQLLPIFQR
jgi:hypothetical protein